MSDPTRGITCPDKRRVVREALAHGWEWAGFSGTTHCQIRWPKTGAVLRFGSTPSVASWKSLARDIQRESGVEVWRKGNRKRSRKSPRNAPDPQVEASRRRYARTADQREERRIAVARMKAAADRAKADDRRRRDIEELMR